MTDRKHRPDVEHRMERSYEVVATPEQVWDAIATAEGISAWMVPTRLDPQVGLVEVLDNPAEVARRGAHALEHGHRDLSWNGLVPRFEEAYASAAEHAARRR